MNDEAFKALPVKWAVSETKNGFPQFECSFVLIERLENGEWIDISANNQTMTGYFVMANDKGIFEWQIEALSKSLGWSGSSLSDLQNGDWSSTTVQLVVGDNTYDGKTTRKVKFINPVDYAGGTGGVKDADPQIVQSLDSKYGAQLRAKAGPSKPVNNPAKNPNATPAEVAKQEAWKAYTATANGTPKAQVIENFKAAFASYFPGRKAEMCSAADWKAFVADGFAKKQQESPISGEPVFAEDDIPF